MSGPAELSIWTGALLDAGLKATVVVAAGAGVSWAVRRRPAAVRHAVWAVTLGGLPILPVIARARGAEVAVDEPWLLVVWVLGAFVCAVPLLRGLWALRRLPRGAGSAVRIVRSDAFHTPMTWGFWRPTIGMPAASAMWEREERDLALAHELAHVRRGDWLVHVLAHVVAAVFWFHPLVWLSRRQLMLEAEHAADDVVLATGAKPSAYAALLLRLSKGRPLATTLGAGTQVGKRVRAILDGRARSSSRRFATTFLVMCTAAATPALAAWPTWSAPQEVLTCTPELSP